MPDATWDKNWKNIQTTAELADGMGLKLVTFHVGFLPHDLDDPEAKKLQQRLGMVADLFKSRGINLGLETGQETAADLWRLLQRLNRPNLGVNLIRRTCFSTIKAIQLKRSKHSAAISDRSILGCSSDENACYSLGEEVPVGSGEVDWKAFFGALKELNYDGNLVVEREAGNQRDVDIKQARTTLSNI